MGPAIVVGAWRRFPAIVVGISGHYGAGKDAAASILIRRYGFMRIAFADALKREVISILRRPLEEYLRVAYPDDPDRTVEDLVFCRRDAFSRALLQAWGTELRRTEDPRYWIRRWFESLPAGQKVVTPDVRFMNEVEAIRTVGGLLLKIERPGHTGDSHRSETELAQWHGWDAVVVNDGSLDDLERKVSEWYEETVYGLCGRNI